MPVQIPCMYVHEDDESAAGEAGQTAPCLAILSSLCTHRVDAGRRVGWLSGLKQSTDSGNVRGRSSHIRVAKRRLYPDGPSLRITR